MGDVVVVVGVVVGVIVVVVVVVFEHKWTGQGRRRL